jgi:L-lactate dehydrogenase complex protein LldG
VSAAREEILGRVRAALRDVAADDSGNGDLSGRSPVVGGEAEREAPGAELVDRFCERVADYRAEVRRVGAGEVAATLAAACADRGARRIAAPADMPREWHPDGVELVPDDGDLSGEDLDGVDGVLTGCALGIAETGTFALDGGARQGRRALTLLPDLHLCVVEAEQIVDDVPVAMERLEPAAREGRPITLVSGPSATSDIELQRVEGVHGPRDLVVVVVE